MSYYNENKKLPSSKYEPGQWQVTYQHCDYTITYWIPTDKITDMKHRLISMSTGEVLHIPRVT